MTATKESIPEEIIELTYSFLPPARQAEVDGAVRALQEDARLEFLLAVLEVKINDRRLSPQLPPGRPLLKKLLQALDEEEGAMMLYSSPYNHLGRTDRPDADPRLEWWDFDIGDQLHRFPDLRSIRAFLEHGTGFALGRPPAEAQQLHDQLLHGLVDDCEGYAIWACSDVRTAGQLGTRTSDPDRGVWPATDISPWFHGVFWDDVIFILNPAESTLVVFALTSS